MIDFRLKAFCSVAHHLSFTKASKELGVSQPAISKHIQELETEYNTLLFERMGTHISLTPEGELLLGHAEQILRLYRRLDFEMNLLAQCHTGELRLGASATIARYLLPAYLATFQQRFKSIRVSLIDGESREIEQAIEERRIDLGLIENNKRRPHLLYTSFSHDELVCVTDIHSDLVEQDEITLNELSKLPLVVQSNGSDCLDSFERALATHQLNLPRLHIILQLESAEAIKSYLLHTSCIGIVSKQSIITELAEKKLKILRIAGFTCEREFHFVRHPERTSDIASNFMRYMTRSF